MLRVVAMNGDLKKILIYRIDRNGVAASSNNKDLKNDVNALPLLSAALWTKS